MRAILLAIGSELTNGSKLDTNSQWLTSELLAVGILVRAHVTLPDDLADLVRTIRDAAALCDLLVIGGGLGPTLDDLTREAIAAAFDRKLVLHKESLVAIQELFVSRGREMPERNRLQAMLPEGAEVLPNARGTAPGIWLEVPSAESICRIAALPGVPSELRPMFLDQVVPRLPAGQGTIKRYAVNCFGLGESAVEELLGDLTARGRDPEVGITASEATISLRILARGATAAECDAQAEPVKRLIYERLGDHVFGEEDQTLADVVVSELIRRGESLAVLESPLTAGRIGQSLCEVPGIAKVFRGSLVLPDRKSIDAWIAGDATQDLPLRLAAFRERIGSDWLLLTLPREMVPSQEQHVEGAIAAFGRGVSQIVEYRGIGDPGIRLNRATKTALDFLRRRIM